MKRDGLLNWIINILPFELHIPGYNYCGPGTKLQKRLDRGDRGINKLDEYCKEHDIAYSKSTNLCDRRKADKVLMNMAEQRALASDSGIGEKLAAKLVHKVMLAKMKTGNGLKHCRTVTSKTDCRRNTFGKGMKKTFKRVIEHTKKQLKKLKPKGKKMAAELAIAAVKDFAEDKTIKLPRVIPIPKTGGVLPLIPLFAGLSAAGSLAGGAAGIAKMINDFKAAKKRFQELKRHNERLEALCIGKGLHLKPHKNGLGIFVTRPKN